MGTQLPEQVIELADARALLHWAGDPLGADPGLFVTRLIKTMLAADEENLEKLRAVWPGLVAAVEAYRREIDWQGILRAIAREGIGQ